MNFRIHSLTGFQEDRNKNNVQEEEEEEEGVSVRIPVIEQMLLKILRPSIKRKKEEKVE